MASSPSSSRRCPCKIEERDDERRARVREHAGTPEELLDERAGIFVLAGQEACDQTRGIGHDVGELVGADRVEGPLTRGRGLKCSFVIPGQGFGSDERGECRSGGAGVRREPIAQRLGSSRAHQGDVAVVVGTPGRGREHSGAPPGRRSLCATKRGLGPLTDTGRPTKELLESEHGDDAQAELAVFGRVSVEGPGNRSAEVVQLGVETPCPHDLVRAFEASPGLLGECRVVLGVAAAALHGLARVIETLQRVLAQRFVQAIPRAPIGTVVEDNHRLRSKIIERVPHIPRR